MLVSYVSDERFVALADVLLEIANEKSVAETRSTASGAVYADIEPGTFRVTLAHPGYGSKIVDVAVSEGKPYQFRLLLDGLLGYLWPKWVRAGQRSEFRVHSDEAYKLELWRYGLHKELVKPIGWFDEHGPRAMVQVSPDGDYTQTGVMWNKVGYASPHHKQFVKAPDRSGLYYCHATGESGAFFSFPWIVAPAHPTARVAVLASNISWNCYNNFGGRSNYISPDRMPPKPTVNARFELRRYTDEFGGSYDSQEYLPLSFERPEPINHVPEAIQVTDPIEGRAACHVAPAEWRLLGWLEREGFDYDIWAETQLHAGDLQLDQYDVLILGPHPEYWSSGMYYELKDWVFNRGGKLLYLGGNGLNCEVDFLDETTIVVHNGRKEDWPDGSFESRFDVRQESKARLLGVAFTHTGIMTAAPYRAADADHWVFAGTGLAKGTNLDNGGAEMVFHEPGKEGMVFSTGSINYVSSLLVCETVSQITKNVLNRFLEDES